MAPQFKVTYFPIKAVAEPIRFLLSYGNLDFEDKRVSPESWPALKPSMPFGQVPILEENGKIAHQSVSICRYLAKKVKLIGDNDWENLEIDSVVDTVNDLRLKIAPYHYDPSVRESLKGPLFNDIIPFYLGRLEEIVKKNKGHLAAGKLTWADLVFAAWSEYLNAMAGKNIFEKYPNLQALINNIFNIPQIKVWINKRPNSDT